MHGGRDIEVGVVGREGVTGTAIVQGDTQSPHITFVQVQGAAYRIEADQFRYALSVNKRLRDLLTAYVRALAIQVSYTALANGRSKIEERLARWLLMVHDRVDGDRFNLTHEFLAVMLGVRRPGVTVSLHVLEGNGLIKSNRGEVIILDREGLIDLANGSYGVPEREYERLIARQMGQTHELHMVAKAKQPRH
jgi:CRP-like cAMP-binding protein